MALVKAHFSFSPRILEHLGISAYNSVRKCLAELVANSHDADSRIVCISIPSSASEEAGIVLTDDGCGMSLSDLRDNFLHIGRDRRQSGDETQSGRLVIGSKGIGKLAGFGIASRIRVTSRHGGKQSQITITKAQLESIHELAAHKFDVEVSRTSKPNGTTIELMDLHDGVHLPPPEVLRRHLFSVMPQLPDFKISVNGVECSAGDVIGEKTPFLHDIPGVGRVTGFYTIANARQPAPGLAVRVRGRIVQEPSLFGLDTRAHGFFTSEKIVGEINAEFMDPPGRSKGRRDLIKTSRDGFLEDSEIVKRFNLWAAGFVKRIVAGVDKKETKKRTDNLVDRPEIRARLDALPPHIKLSALKVVRGIVSRLKTASDEDAEVLIEWILRYYESNQLKELMQAILAADIGETEKLATLINHWGVYQLNQVVSIIDSEIRIISRLEELIKSQTSREIDLHKLIENNLWLIQKGLEVWGSDKPLKTLLDKKIKALYKNKEHLRPDLVCRSRDSGQEAIILEFKRPREIITMAHVTQALTYAGIIGQHRPNTRFKTYVIGSQYSSDVLAVRKAQEQAGLYLRSFDEILQSARERFQDTLAILER